jgi:hypothetical protein
MDCVVIVFTVLDVALEVLSMEDIDMVLKDTSVILVGNLQ